MDTSDDHDVQPQAQAQAQDVAEEEKLLEIKPEHRTLLKLYKAYKREYDFVRSEAGEAALWPLVYVEKEMLKIQ